jgi:hypothetical protein
LLESYTVTEAEEMLEAVELAAGAVVILEVVVVVVVAVVAVVTSEVVVVVEAVVVTLEVVVVVEAVVVVVVALVEEVVVVLVVTHKSSSQNITSSQNMNHNLPQLIHYQRLRNCLLSNRRTQNPKIHINWLEDLVMVPLVSRPKSVPTI